MGLQRHSFQAYENSSPRSLSEGKASGSIKNSTYPKAVARPDIEVACSRSAELSASMTPARVFVGGNEFLVIVKVNNTINPISCNVSFCVSCHVHVIPGAAALEEANSTLPEALPASTKVCAASPCQ